MLRGTAAIQDTELKSMVRILISLGWKTKAKTKLITTDNFPDFCWSEHTDSKSIPCHILNKWKNKWKEIHTNICSVSFAELPWWWKSIQLNTYTLNSGCSIPTSFRMVPTILNCLFRWNLLPQTQHLYAHLVHLEMQLLQLTVPSLIPLLKSSWVHSSFKAWLRLYPQPAPVHSSYWNESPTCLAPPPHPTFWLLDCDPLWRAERTAHPLHTPLVPTWQNYPCLLIWILVPLCSLQFSRIGLGSIVQRTKNTESSVSEIAQESLTAWTVGVNGCLIWWVILASIRASHLGPISLGKGLS